MNVDHFRSPRPRTICFPFLGRTVGGSTIAAMALATALPAPWQPLFVLHERGSLSAHLDAAGVPYEVLPLPAMIGDDLQRLPVLLQVARATPGLMGFLRRRKIGIVHANDGRMNVTWAGAAQLAGSGFIWHQHSRYQSSRFGNAFARAADRIIGVSSFATAAIPAALQGRVRIIPNPFDVAKAVPNRAAARRDLIQSLGLDPGALILGYFGNLTEQKRPVVFAQAVEMIRRREPRAVGVLCGELREPLAEVLRGYAGTRLMGFQFPPEPILAACDLLLAPAAREGFGRAVVEAMLVGTPVIAARSGGHIDIVRDGETGILVPLDDPQALAEAALGLLASPERCRTLADAAAKHAVQAYPLDAHVEAVLRTYAEVW